MRADVFSREEWLSEWGALWMGYLDNVQTVAEIIADCKYQFDYFDYRETKTGVSKTPVFCFLFAEG